jgi:hypothetical protein
MRWNRNRCTDTSLLRSSRMASFKPHNKTIPGTSQPNYVRACVRACVHMYIQIHEVAKWWFWFIYPRFFRCTRYTEASDKIAVNDELERIWQKAVISRFKVFVLIRGNHETSIRTVSGLWLISGFSRIQSKRPTHDQWQRTNVQKLYHAYQWSYVSKQNIII